MSEFVLPWPASNLSPNKRLHWAVVAKAKRLYRRDCWLATLNQHVVVPDGSLTLQMEFHPPTNRRFDRDNLVARMKAGLDGVADALQIDDELFSWISATVGSIVPGGSVKIQITGETNGDKKI